MDLKNDSNDPKNRRDTPSIMHADPKNDGDIPPHGLYNTIKGSDGVEIRIPIPKESCDEVGSAKVGKDGVDKVGKDKPNMPDSSLSHLSKEEVKVLGAFLGTRNEVEEDKYLRQRREENDRRGASGADQYRNRSIPSPRHSSPGG